MNTSTTRAGRVRLELFRRIGYGYVSKVARALDYNRTHVSLVLNGHDRSDILLDKIEAWLEEQEQEAA